MKTKSFLSVIFLFLVVFSCSNEGVDVNEQNPYSVSLEGLAGTDKVSPISISIIKMDGKIVGVNEDLEPNTKYRILLNALDVNIIRIRKGDGFDIIQQPSLVSKNQEYLIKTHADVSSQIYASLVPIHKIGSILLREKPQALLLP